MKIASWLRHPPQWLRHPVASLDDWWAGKVEHLRLDHNISNLCVLIGLICAASSILLVGPSPMSTLRLMAPQLQMSMCGCIFMGCVIKLHGVFGHSRFWFPRMSLKRCYQLGYNGAPIASGGLFVYGWYLLETTPTWTSALGAVLTPMLGMGVLLQGGVYWLESRRLEHVEQQMINHAKMVKGLQEQ